MRKSNLDMCSNFKLLLTFTLVSELDQPRIIHEISTIRHGNLIMTHKGTIMLGQYTQYSIR